MVDKDILIKVKLSKYLSTDGESYAHQGSDTKMPTSSYRMTKDNNGRGYYLIKN